jgi:hypothetical protein
MRYSKDSRKPTGSVMPNETRRPRQNLTGSVTPKHSRRLKPTTRRCSKETAMPTDSKRLKETKSEKHCLTD